MAFNMRYSPSEHNTYILKQNDVKNALQLYRHKFKLCNMICNSDIIVCYTTRSSYICLYIANHCTLNSRNFSTAYAVQHTSRDVLSKLAMA